MRFAYRLALAVGEPDVRRVLALPADVLAGWMGFAELEPFGELRNDLRAATVAATVANAFSTGKGKPAGPDDFFESLKPPVVRGKKKDFRAFRRWANMNAPAWNAFREKYGKRKDRRPEQE